MALIHYYVHPTIATREDALLHEVAPSDVPTDTRAVAEKVRREVSAHLGLSPTIRIRWLPPETKNIFGITFFLDAPYEIWLMLRDHAGVVETTAHELKHLALARETSSWSRAGGEEAATAFGLKVRHRFEAGRPLVDPPSPARTAPAPRPATITTTTASASAPVSHVERQRRERLWRETYGPLHEAERQRVAALRAWAGGFPERPTSRRTVIHDVKGRLFAECRGCGEMTPVNTAHRCPAGARAAGRR